MSWPSPQDYQEAIQAPRHCFADQELQRGSPRLDYLGLPKPISGSFASVYEITSYGRRWAVRCFLREFPDQQQRYEKISLHLHEAKLPYTVGFQFQAKGIRIRGRWYPILKMEWVDGIPLITYIEQNVSRPDVLRVLTEQWRELITALKQSSIAHGDLQHGNILIAQQRIRLIDYDGMFVPALTGFASHEIGHRNYQHPRRSLTDFDVQLDNFSAWVIYLSLTAVASEPDLWGRLGAGNEEERLLVGSGDFDPARPSPALERLKQSRDPQVRLLANSLQELLHLPPSRIPSLDGKPIDINANKATSFGLPGWLTLPRPTESQAQSWSQIGRKNIRSAVGVLVLGTAFLALAFSVFTHAPTSVDHGKQLSEERNDQSPTLPSQPGQREISSGTPLRTESPPTNTREAVSVGESQPRVSEDQKQKQPAAAQGDCGFLIGDTIEEVGNCSEEKYAWADEQEKTRIKTAIESLRALKERLRVEQLESAMPMRGLQERLEETGKEHQKEEYTRAVEALDESAKRVDALIERLRVAREEAQTSVFRKVKGGK